MAKATTPIFSPAEMAIIAPAMYQTWNYIAGDVEEFVDSNESCVEMCVDAGRLSSCGRSPEAETLVSTRAHDVGYPKVLKFHSKEIDLF